ncbi:MAG TPA: cytochrome c, partial [Casimicrobiaceae bacterium]|nr:cytochrome c [Casimicrobiaceae bacterium]
MPRARSSSGTSSTRAQLVRVVAGGALAVAAIFVVVGPRDLTSLEAAPRIGPDSITFAADVAPILYKNCVSCHRPGGIGPFSMLNFDTVAGRVKDIADVLHEGKMPPWHAVAPPGTFRNER